MMAQNNKKSWITRLTRIVDTNKRKTAKFEDRPSITSSSSSNISTSSSNISISSEKMKEMFPYHVVVNKSFEIVQFGSNLEMLIQKSISINLEIKKVFAIERPILMDDWDWIAIHKLKDQTFFLKCVENDEIKLKANVVELSTSPYLVMFNISPDVKNVTELHDMELTMSDLPLHSFQRDAVFLGEHMYSEVRSAHKLDRLAKKLANERNLSNTLLYSMLPENVADLLRSGETYEPIQHDDVTLFFSDVVGFTSMCAELDPWEIIDMLNTLYTVMDHLSAKFGLYKVETIGDAYMCCSGLPEPDDLNAVKIANFAIAVQECVKLVTSPLTGEPIRLRVGIHSGHCMSGVVGTLTPHYCLFGDMINTTSRHESTGEAGRVQVSSITFGKIQHFSEQADQFTWTPRGLVPMKGKGEMFTYWLDGGTDKNDSVGPDALAQLVKEVEGVLDQNAWKKRKYFVSRRGSTVSTEYTDFASLDNFNVP